MATIIANRMDLTGLNHAASGVPGAWDLPDEGRSLHVLVLFTDVPSTLAALRYAANIPHAERAPIRLLVPQVVPYPLPLHEPAVRTSLLTRRFRTIAEQASVATTVDIWLCRDPWEAIHQSMATPHLVVIGTRRRWWPTREERIAKRLRSEGHFVLLTQSN